MKFAWGFQLNKKYAIVIVVVVIVVIGGVILFSDDSVTTANISDVKMSESIDENLNPIGITETFSPDTLTIYLTGQMNNVPSDTELKVDWHYLDAEDENDYGYVLEGEDTLIYSAEYKLDESQGVSAQIARKAEYPPFPTGSYEVRIYIDGSNVKNVQFSVEE